MIPRVLRYIRSLRSCRQQVKRCAGRCRGVRHSMFPTLMLSILVIRTCTSMNPSEHDTDNHVIRYEQLILCNEDTSLRTRQESGILGFHVWRITHHVALRRRHGPRRRHRAELGEELALPPEHLHQLGAASRAPPPRSSPAGRPTVRSPPARIAGLSTPPMCAGIIYHQRSS